MFLRLAICNLACSWCDTKFSWQWSIFDYKKETKRMSIEELYSEFYRFYPDVDRLVISGGEPMLQQKKLVPLVELLHSDGWKIEIETAGTVAPLIDFSKCIAQFNVSPKLAHSGNSLEKRFNPYALAMLNLLPSSYKFVVQETEDLKEVAWICSEAGIPSEKVYIMPEGTNPERLNRVLSNIIEPAIQCGYNVTTRMHVMAWGEKRGV
jgi:organic radical activating enzyme